MYKKLILLLVFIFVAFTTSGCVKDSVNIEVTKNDQVILTKINAVNNTLFMEADPEYNSEDPLKSWKEDKTNKSDLDRVKRKGYSVADFKDEDYIGLQYKKLFKKPNFFTADDLPEGYLLATEAKSPVEIKKSPFGTKYSIHLMFEPKRLNDTIDKKISSQDRIKEMVMRNINVEEENPEENPEENLEEVSEENPEENPEEASQKKPSEKKLNIFEPREEDQQNYIPAVDLTIKIPKKAKEHNATSYDSKTHEYKWDFSKMEDVKENKQIEIILKYEKTNYFSIIFIILIIIATLVVLDKNKEYNKKSTDETTSAY